MLTRFTLWTGHALFCTELCSCLSGVLREVVILPSGSWYLNYELLTLVTYPRDSLFCLITFVPLLIRPLFKMLCFGYEILHNSLYLCSEYRTFKEMF